MNRQVCSCPKTDCKRHGLCNDCRAYHVEKGKIPYCDRPKKQKKTSLVDRLKKSLKL
jgi:hypothetical protein